jgi:hypothetical protein
MVQLLSWQANSPSSIEYEGSLSCSQEPSIGPCPELDESNLPTPTLFP